MRKHQQKQILGIVETLKQAVEEIRRSLSQRDFRAAIDLLADCQNSAVSIGNFVEAELGSATRSVAHLEEFCDTLYAVGAAAESGQIEMVKQLKRQLIAIESCLIRELKPDRMEIVFFPYKAEMWDSMESVWRAAIENEHCDAYVVPIPYFNRSPDGSLGSMRIDGDLFPAYVPTTQWQSYHLEDRHPDAIVIHNPYDNGNFVTTVHPDYYATELKKHTDLLCYIPYFVSPEILQEHFCLLSGVKLADRVFVQSEDVRQFYLKTIRNFEKQHKCAGSFGKLEKKIVASGSPKFDQAILSKPEDYSLPDEWRRKIENPDGSRKNVVLYCTSLGSLLQGGDEYLKKLEYELKSLGERRDIALWWRPHPLQGATYKAMRPQLLRAYQEIIARYLDGGWGIYDDTAGLHRALTHGSIYYGDWSSLLLLFGAIGKRIMLHEPGFIEKSGQLCFEEIAFDRSGNAWGRERFLGGLYALDLENDKAHLMPEGETLPQSASFGNNSPQNGEFVSYSEFFAKLPAPDDLAAQGDAYQAPVRIGDKVYTFARFNKTVYSLDIHHGEVAAHAFAIAAEDAARVADSAARYRKGVPGARWEDFILRENVYAHELFGKIRYENDTERMADQKRAFLTLTASPEGAAGKAILKEIIAQTGPFLEGEWQR